MYKKYRRPTTPEPFVPVNSANVALFSQISVTEVITFVPPADNRKFQ